MSAVIARIVADAFTGLGPTAPTWVREYSPDGEGGRGRIRFTTERASAKRFASLQAALEEWRTVSKTHPIRPDGKPNRPLTAYTMTFEPVEPSP